MLGNNLSSFSEDGEETREDSMKGIQMSVESVVVEKLDSGPYSTESIQSIVEELTEMIQDNNGEYTEEEIQGAEDTIEEIRETLREWAAVKNTTEAGESSAKEEALRAVLKRAEDFLKTYRK